ncbi:MAG: hypothetical protein HYY37_05770 [Candidatus Aenigmarchaeota archaeon]|nr:hypothetical protein [Candidatus Aenigmarchaeota archaeon]
MGINQGQAINRITEETSLDALYGFVPRGSKVTIFRTEEASTYANILASLLGIRGRGIEQYPLNREHAPQVRQRATGADRVLVVYETGGNGSYPLTNALDIFRRAAEKGTILEGNVGVIVVEAEPFAIVPLAKAIEEHPYQRRRRH